MLLNRLCACCVQIVGWGRCGGKLADLPASLSDYEDDDEEDLLLFEDEPDNEMRSEPILCQLPSTNTFDLRLTMAGESDEIMFL